jgi:hypothetical protein
LKLGGNLSIADAAISCHGRYARRCAYRLKDLQSGEMTTREKIHKLVDELPESQLDPVADFIATRGRPDDVVDEWGNVSAMLRGSTGRAMRRLDEQESEAGRSPW